jgi:hypothetical protein
VHKYSVLYTAKIHNKKPPSQDGVLFYYTQNWRLRLYDCDNRGNMGMEIALDFRKIDLHQGDEFILAGKYRVIVDELLSSEAVVVPPPLGAGLRVPARGREANYEEADGSSSKRKRSGLLLRPGELAHGQSDRALRDVIREQNESINEQRRQQGRRSNRQWTMVATPAASTRKSNGGSWQQQLQHQLEQQLQQRLHQHQNQQQHYQREQQPPQKRSDRKLHPQSVPTPLILTTKSTHLPKQQLYNQPEGKVLLPPQRNSNRSNASADSAAISRLDAALGDFDDLKFLSEFSDRPNVTSDGDDGDVEVLDVMHPIPVSTTPMPLNTFLQQQQHRTPPVLSRSANSSGDKPLALINGESHAKIQLPVKALHPLLEKAAPTTATTAGTMKKSAVSILNKNPATRFSPEPLRPPSFSKSHFPTASALTSGLGSSGGGGLRCLQGISSGPMPRLPLWKPPPVFVGTSNGSSGHDNASKNNNDYDCDDFRTVSANGLADLDQLEANLRASLQKEKNNSLETKNLTDTSFRTRVQGHSVTELKTRDDDETDVEVLEIKDSPPRVSKSKVSASPLDEFGDDIDDIFFSDAEPNVASAILPTISNNENGLCSSDQSAPAKPHNQNQLHYQGSTAPEPDFDDYDFKDETDLVFSSSSCQPMTTSKVFDKKPDIELVVDAGQKGKGNNKGPDTQMAEEISEIDMDEHSEGQQDSDLPDDFFEEGEDGGGMLLASSPEPRSPIKTIMQSGPVKPKDDDGNVVTMTHGPSLSISSTGNSSVVEIQPSLVSSVSAVAVTARSSTPLVINPEQISQGLETLTKINGDGATAAAAAGEIDTTTQGLANGSHQGPDLEETTRSFTEIDFFAHALDPAPAEAFSAAPPTAPTAVPITKALSTYKNATTPPQNPTKSHPAVAKGEELVALAAPPPLPHAAPSLPPVPRIGPIGQPSLSSSPLRKPTAAAAAAAVSTITATAETEAAAVTSALISALPLPHQTGFGRPKNRVTLGPTTTITITTSASVTSGTSTDASPNVTPGGNSNNSNSKNNPQFVPPVSRAHLLQHVAAAQCLKQKEAKDHSHAQPPAQPIVLVAEAYGAWTTETMDLFSWRPSSS